MAAAILAAPAQHHGALTMPHRVATQLIMQRLRIALEWFLNPDHLPLIAARDRLRDDGWDIELVIPDDHYDGFQALANGEVDLVVNEPLHLVERRDLRLTAWGCFFATDGGVLMHSAALSRMLSGHTVRIASPVSNPTTNQLCVDILKGWAAKQGFALNEKQVFIDAAGFSHVDNLASGHDGAWLAFANVEGVSAQVRGLDTQLITTAEAGIPNFSALELIGAADAPVPVRDAIAAFIAAIGTATPALQSDPEAARQLWYSASGEAHHIEGDAIVAASLPKFLVPVRRNAAMWRPMWRYLQARGGDVVDETTFDAMFAPHDFRRPAVE